MVEKMSDDLTSLKGVGSQTITLLYRLGIYNTNDLIDYYPRTYEDYSNVTAINKLKPGPVTIKAEISSVKGRYVRRGLHITEALATDKSGSVQLVWFNQPYRANSLVSSEQYFISGDFGFRSGRVSFVNPSIERAKNFLVNTARIVPVYKETKGLTSKQIRRFIAEAIHKDELTETLPGWIIDKYKLLPRREAVFGMHFPDSSRHLALAKKRLGFEEIFCLTYAALDNKRSHAKKPALPIIFDESLAKKFVNQLPFQLTDDQRKAVWQIYQDMALSQPMNRLIEGDVGSGKTVVATMATMMAIAEGYQVAFMAPTELLARQHSKTMFQLLSAVGMEEHLVLLVGSQQKKQKQDSYEQIESGKKKLIVGTHALIQDSVRMKKLGLVIVDEQHRFGVEQRKKLQQKAEYMPHVLHMTATPIPRSLALTLYGELSITKIIEKPANRKQINTVLESPETIRQVYESVRRHVSGGAQVYVVCPFIEKNSDLPLVADVESVFTDFKNKQFKDLRIGLLHGKLKSDEKDAVMSRFVDHKIDILVSTTVIEVGVDVPNANCMVILGAERFGLAQIHQLRGRVGRSEKQADCYLVPSSAEMATKRLEIMTYTDDGFALAEYDLKLRGPGAIYGTAQHGALDLRVANLTDTELIKLARRASAEAMESGLRLVQYPQLRRRVQQYKTVTNLQ